MPLLRLQVWHQQAAAARRRGRRQPMGTLHRWAAGCSRAGEAAFPAGCSATQLKHRLWQHARWPNSPSACNGRHAHVMRSALVAQDQLRPRLQLRPRRPLTGAQRQVAERVAQASTSKTAQRFASSLADAPGGADDQQVCAVLCCGPLPGWGLPSSSPAALPACAKTRLLPAGL